MKDKPRRSGKDGDFIITRPMAYNIFGVGFAFVVILMGLLFYFHAQDGLTPHDLSWFFSFFVMLQFWNMFNAKAFMEGRSAFANLKDSKSFLLVALLILIGQYLIVTFGDKNALFLTRSHTRMTTAAVHYMVKQRLLKAGLDPSLYSSHKLRHTAATLMLLIQQMPAKT